MIGVADSETNTAAKFESPVMVVGLCAVSASFTAVPMARAKMVCCSVSKSKYCLYPMTALPFISNTFLPSCLRSWPLRILFNKRG